MIDATKGPVPAWKRYGLIVLVAVLVVAGAGMIWTKELHHSIPGLSKSKPAATAPASASASTAPTTVASKSSKPVATTIPGGIPVSARDPFTG